MMETTHPVALEAGQYFCDADSINQFLKNIFNEIKPAVENIRNAESAEKSKSNNTKPGEVKTQKENELEKFVKQLDSESYKIFGDKKWVDIMGTTVLKNGKLKWKEGTGDFDILKCNDKYNAKTKKYNDTMNIDGKESKKASVVELLRLIRNKAEHILAYPDEIKEKLPMFFEHEIKFVKGFTNVGVIDSMFIDKDAESQEFKFNLHKFISYWILKFPRLVSFLWVKFYPLRYLDALQSYYPLHRISNGNDFSLMPIDEPNNSHVELNDLVNLLNKALITHLEKGKLFCKLHK